MNEEPSEVNMYVSGLVKIGHDTRELVIQKNNIILNPLTNEPMLFQRIKGGVFHDYTGLVRCILVSGESPRKKLITFMQQELGVTVENPGFKCRVTEIICRPDKTAHNISYVFLQRLACAPAAEIDTDSNIQLEEINIPDIYRMKSYIHPTDYEILKRWILTAKHTQEPSTNLEIILEPQGKSYKPTSAVWS